MSSFTNYLEDAVLNHVFRNVPLPSPTAVYLALFTTDPTEAGGGTEVSGAGYARQTITFGAPSGGAIQNTSAVNYTASGGNFGTITHVGVFDAATGGNMLAHDPITSVTINDTDDLTFDVGELDITLD